MNDPHEDFSDVEGDWREEFSLSPEEIKAVEEMDRLIESLPEYQEMLEKVVRETIEDDGEEDRLSTVEEIQNWLRNL